MEKMKINGRSRLLHEPEGLTISQIKANAVKKWHWFLIFGFVCVLIAFLYNKVTEPKYRISTTVLVKNDTKVAELFNIFQNPQRSNGKTNSVISDQIGVINSYSLNLKAMQDLNWQYSWSKKKLLSKSDLYGEDPFELVLPNESIQQDMVPLTITVENDNSYTVSADSKKTINGRDVEFDFEKRVAFGEPFKNKFFNFTLNKSAKTLLIPGDKYVLEFNNLAKLAQEYKDRLDITQADENSNLIRVNLETRKLHRDVQYLNKLGSLYIQSGLDEKNKMANNTVRFIDNLIAGVNDSLQVAGNSFTDFRSKNKTVNLGQEATKVVDKLKDLDTEQSKLNLKLDYYSNLKYYLDNSEEIKDLVAPSLIGVNDPDMNSMVAKLNDLYSKREVLSYTVQEKNPTLVALNNEIQFTQKVLGEKVANMIGTTNLELKSIQARLQKVNGELVRLPKTEQDLIGIKRNYDLNNELYTFLLQRRAEADIARASNNADAQILDPAAVEIAELLGPKSMKNLITGLLAGLILALLAVIFNEYFSDKFKTADEIANMLDMPVTASITRNRAKSEMPVIHFPKSAITESFRGLRINLQNRLKGSSNNVIAVHSCISGEGKSFVALNLALIMAISNRKVLLIDCDLRKPRLHQLLKSKNESGLSQFLVGKKTAEEVIQKTQRLNLQFVPAGPLLNNPAEFLNSGALRSFIERVRHNYDIIVLDNAPIGVVSDARLVGLYADINLFLLRMNYSEKKESEIINRYYSEDELKNVMVAVNGIEQSRGYGYYNEDAKVNEEVKVS